MKIQLIQKMTWAVVMAVGSVTCLYAQDDFTPVDTTIVMDPGMFIPADTGYFVAGVYKDLDGDGIDEFYNGCYDAYGDADHREDGVQHGWEYENVIIFRGCEMVADDDVIKGTQPEENWPTEGNLIQVTKHKDALTDSASFGYIASPAFTNLESLTVKVSTDLSINASRQIWMLVEASLDEGETWEYIDNPDGEAFVLQQLTNQGGDIHTYTAGSSAEFDAIIAASQAQAIQLRFMPIPPPFSDTDAVNGERLNFWEITIDAQTAPGTGGGNGGGPLATTPSVKVEPFVIRDQSFVSTQGKDLHVYTMSGVLIGKGQRVPICEGGLYIVRTLDGDTRKIFIK